MSAAMDINILLQYPWIIYPAFIIIMTVFFFFSLGYSLKDAFDPKSRVSDRQEFDLEDKDTGSKKPYYYI